LCHIDEKENLLGEVKKKERSNAEKKTRERKEVE
jgi:hypothetical protein